MKKHLYFTAALLALLLLFCSCQPGDTASVAPTESITAGASEQPTPSGKEYKYDENGNVVQQPDVRDYTTMWWRDGFNRGGRWQMNMQTGYYGLTVNTVTGSISTLGAIEQEITQTQAGQGDNALLESLPKVTSSYSVIDTDGTECTYAGTDAVGGGSISSRILETGRYMQRIDIMSLKFRELDDIVGRVEYAVMPEYMALEFALYAKDRDAAGMGMRYRINLPSTYTEISYSCGGRAVTAARPGGEGLTFVLPDMPGVSLEVESSVLSFTYSGVTLKKNTFVGFGVVIIPSVKASAQDAINYIMREQLRSSAVQITPDEGREQEVSFDSTKGYLSIDMNKMMSVRANQFQNEELLDDYDRLRFTITNDSAADIKLPIQFVKDKNFGVEGFCPMLRDAETGEPIGVQVQLSKNWHSMTTDKNSPFYAARNDPKRYWSGLWFHGYTMLDIPAGKSVTYEICITYATWGGVYACSHSQISLAGWGGNYQQWETSAVGSFGENFCYDPEQAHGTGAFINDILPFLTYGQSGEKYSWSNGVSGGNMLNYYNADGLFVPVTGVQTCFKSHGPNLTEVVYTAVTKDGAIKVQYGVSMGRTDDAAKAVHSFKYTFLKDVGFTRLSFYSIGSDTYNVSYKTFYIGNADGPQDVTLGSESFPGGYIELDYFGRSGYIGSDGQQRAEIGGQGLFVLCDRPGNYLAQYGLPGSRMLNLLSYSASINGRQYDKPAVSMYISAPSYGTVYDSAAVELCPQAEVGNTIKAGSTVEGTVEYIPLPTGNGEKENGYYGSNSAMLALPEENYTLALAMLFVRGDRYSAAASTGEVTCMYPLKIRAQAGETAAEFTLTGGMGYTAVTFTGLDRFDGWRLQQKQGDGWEALDQSVHGNDYWQCRFDAEAGSYEMTYNVPCSGDPEQTQVFRLVRR